MNSDMRAYMPYHYGTGYMPYPYYGTHMGYGFPPYGKGYYHHYSPHYHHMQDATCAVPMR